MDITLCKGNNCPIKEQCKRYIYKPDFPLYQSYFTESPIKDGKCDMFWGDVADDIMEQLKTITNENNNN
jgi:hypothetical protein